MFEISIRHAVTFDLQLLLGVALVIDVVRRIGEHQVRGLTTHEPLDIRWRRGVSYDEFMAPQHPEIAGNRNWHFGQRRRGILVRQPYQGLLLGQQPDQFLFGKAGQVQIEIHVLQGSQFNPQHLFIPAGVEGQSIVNDNQRPTL